MRGRAANVEGLLAEARKMSGASASYFAQVDRYLQDSLTPGDIREEVLREVLDRLWPLERQKLPLSELPPPKELGALLVDELKAERDIPGFMDYLTWEIVGGVLAFYLAFRALTSLIRGLDMAQPLGAEVVFLAILTPFLLWLLVGIVNRATFREVKRRLLKNYIIGFLAVGAFLTWVLALGASRMGWVFLEATPFQQLIYAGVLLASVLLVALVKGLRSAS